MTSRRGQGVIALGLGLALAIGGCALTTREETQDTENLLAAANFTMKPANTPEKLAHLQKMPPRTIVTRTKNDQLVFTYADPEYCKCLWVGNAQQYNAYQKLVQEKKIAQMKLMAAQDAEMSTMDWGMWGPWWW